MIKNVSPKYVKLRNYIICHQTRMSLQSTNAGGLNQEMDTKKTEGNKNTKPLRKFWARNLNVIDK